MADPDRRAWSLRGLVAIALPEIRLSDDAFRSRHRVLRVILWLQVPLLELVARLHAGESDATSMGGMVGMEHVGAAPVSLVWGMVAGVFGCAVLSMLVRTRRASAVIVSLGLLLSAAALVPIGGGATDLHFAFFIVLGLISLYQDWVPLVISVLLVAIDHFILGTLQGDLLYSEPVARLEPLRFALLHAGFVLAMCAVQVTYWHFANTSQVEKENIQARAAEALRRNAERFEALVQDSSDVTIVIDESGLITSSSAAAQHVMGYRPGELAGTLHHALIHAEDLLELIAAEDSQRVEARVRHANGEYHWHDVTIRNLSDHPAVGGVVANHRDITERRMFQERLVYEASHDALTGLANRAELLRSLQAALTELPPATESSTGLAVLYLDLDGFKQVNDSYGHETGDALLKAVAAGLHRCVLGSDTVGRLGGDEFAVVLNHISCVEDAVTVARRILSETAQPVSVNGYTLNPATSIGIALSEPGLQTDQLLHRADTAMYHAKRSRSGSYQLYIDGMHEPDVDASTLEDDLRRAVSGNQLRVHYQPIVALADGELLGLEALVRWQHPERGLLPPAEFIALAEQALVIHDIGQWVLREACTQVLRWQRQVATGHRLIVSVNLFPHELDQEPMTEDVLRILAETGLAPADLVLEVTESALINADSAVPQLTALHDRGVRIALDDFGTGYSSLRYLTRLPVDVLKLDRCFVAELNGTPQGSAVAEAVIRLGQILRLDTVAEGVENEDQATELTLLGCRSGQGFLYARPLRPEQVDALFAGAAGNWPHLPQALVDLPAG
jgi:diguanylate cyclase (GGDEF)-like protein/PAS domain S-box-containing protein